MIYFCCSISPLYLTLYDSLDSSTPGFPVPYHLLDFFSNSCSLIWWCPAISSSVIHFSSCPQSFLTSGSFPMSWLFASGGQGTGASASVLLMNIQGWFTLGLIGLISLKFKGLSRVISSTTVQKHQFFGTQPSSCSNSHTCTWLLGKNHSFDYMELCQQNDIAAFYYTA